MGKRKKRKIIEKIGKEGKEKKTVFLDNFSVSITTCVPETTFKLYSWREGGIIFFGFSRSYFMEVRNESYGF